jgi:hypothetical protein
LVAVKANPDFISIAAGKCRPAQIAELARAVSQSF